MFSYSEVSENKVLRKITRPKYDEISKQFRIINNEDFHDS
jgi:hypothetical protein